MQKIGTIILIVEDDHSLLRALVDKFTIEKFNVLLATNGKDGLKMALEHKPDVILLDILMPKMNGMEMLEKLRGASEWGKRVPVVVLTNMEPNNDVLVQVSKYTPAYYLIKSDFKIEDLVEKIRGLIG